jgi:hypothetical protein
MVWNWESVCRIITSVDGQARAGIAPVAYLPPNRAIQTVEFAPPQVLIERKSVTKPNGFQRFSKWAHNIFSTTPSKTAEANIQTGLSSTSNLPSRQPPELPPRKNQPPETRVSISTQTSMSDKPPSLPPRPRVPLSTPSAPSVTELEKSAPPSHIASGQPEIAMGDQDRGILLESIRKSRIGSLRKVH